VTALVPTDQWVYDLYRVTYHDSEDGPARVTIHVASSFEGHLRADIEERWPGEWATHYRWELVAEDVGHPRVVGNLYGQSVYEGGLEHGERVARKLGLL
jgi:hypothetical protein